MRTEQFNTPVVEENLFHVCERYEAAMHYDCQMCKSECEFRKGTGAGVAMILSFVVVMLLITYSFIF